MENKEKPKDQAAFPTVDYKTVITEGEWPQPEIVRSDNPGMSLRDYFAAKAMQGIMSSVTFLEAMEVVANTKNIEMQEAVAFSAYKYADAMLAERSKDEY